MMSNHYDTRSLRSSQDETEIVYSDTSLRTPGLRRVVSTRSDRVLITSIRGDVRLRMGQTYRGTEREILARAVEFSTFVREDIAVGEVLRPASVVAVVAGRNTIIFRTRSADGRERSPVILLGVEIDGLRRALRALGVSL